MRSIGRLTGRFRKFILHVDTGEYRTATEFSKAAIQITWLARFFYLFVTYSLATHLDFSRVFKGLPFTDPLWPTVLLDRSVGTDWIANHVVLISGTAWIIGWLAVLFPGVLVWRIAVFSILTFFISINFSYGYINHDLHFYVYMSFALLFLPSAAGRPTMRRKDAMSCVSVFWLMQAVTLFTYSLSGLQKVLTNGLEIFAFDGFTKVLLGLFMSNLLPPPPLIPLAVEHYYVAHFFYLAFVYVQALAVFALFRPHLQRPFGIAIIGFHYTSAWLLNIHFLQYPLFWGLLLILSPFSAPRFSLLRTLQSLPLLGMPFRMWAVTRRQKKWVNRAWLVYDGECPFCSSYSQLVDVRESIGELFLVNARNGGPLVDEIMDLGHDLDKGMVLKMGGSYYVGDDALYMLALLSRRRGVFGTVNGFLFSSRAASWLGYPLLRLGRWFVLKLKRIAPITQE